MRALANRGNLRYNSRTTVGIPKTVYTCRIFRSFRIRILLLRLEKEIENFSDFPILIIPGVIWRHEEISAPWSTSRHKTPLQFYWRPLVQSTDLLRLMRVWRRYGEPWTPIGISKLYLASEITVKIRDYRPKWPCLVACHRYQTEWFSLGQVSFQYKEVVDETVDENPDTFQLPHLRWIWVYFWTNSQTCYVRPCFPPMLNVFDRCTSSRRACVRKPMNRCMSGYHGRGFLICLGTCAGEGGGGEKLISRLCRGVTYTLQAVIVERRVKWMDHRVICGYLT